MRKPTWTTERAAATRPPNKSVPPASTAFARHLPVLKESSRHHLAAIYFQRLADHVAGQHILPNFSGVTVYKSAKASVNH